MRIRHAIWTIVGSLLAARAAGDVLLFKDQGKTRRLEGNILARDSLGSLLVEGRDTSRYVIRKAELLRHDASTEKVRLYSRQELRQALERELGGRFKFLQTTHYLVAFSGETDYAREAAKLFERAYSVFTQHFSNLGGFRFQTPRQPLVAIIAGSREEYVRMIAPTLGAMANSTAGVYLRTSNRMLMFDAMGGRMGEWLRAAGAIDRASTDDAVLLLRQQNISTVIHEAVHQIAFNVGFHPRQGELPVWLVEGMAMYFETPDMDATGGWRGAGIVNGERLASFESNFGKRSKDALRQLIVDDERFRQASTAGGAYSEAWALTYYLAKSRTSGYLRYLRLLNGRPAMQRYLPEERLRDFRTAFGQGAEDMEVDFRRFITRLFRRTDST